VAQCARLLALQSAPAARCSGVASTSGSQCSMASAAAAAVANSSSKGGSSAWGRGARVLLLAGTGLALITGEASDIRLAWDIPTRLLRDVGCAAAMILGVHRACVRTHSRATCMCEPPARMRMHSCVF